jgi:fluoride exporter
MMYNIFYVAIGGAAGTVIRYLCQRAFNEESFPYGTLLVNVAGCFIMGILWALLASNSLREQSRLLLITGFCGGFTTFSAFSYESNRLLMDGKIFVFFLYTSISIIAGLFATYGGYKLFAK